MECRGSAEDKEAFESTFKSYKKTCREPACVRLHLDYETVSKKKDERKESLLNRFGDFVSALRNRGGGSLVLHLCRKNDNCRDFQTFDEFALKPLKNLLVSEIYTDTFLRQWLDGHTDILVVTAKKTNAIVISQPNTKITFDHEIQPATTLDLVLIISRAESSEREPELKKIPVDLSHFHEDRHRRFKRFPTGKVNKFIADSAGVFTKVYLVSKYIWFHLRFREYLTCFAQLKDGGSYYLGVEEQRKEKKDPSIEGIDLKEIDFTVEDLEELKKHILGYLEEVFLFTSRGIHRGDSDNIKALVKIGFWPVNDGKFVLEIAVRYVAGIVFYDNGPRALTLETTQTGTGTRHFERAECHKKLFSVKIATSKRNE